MVKSRCIHEVIHSRHTNPHRLCMPGGRKRSVGACAIDSRPAAELRDLLHRLRFAPTKKFGRPPAPPAAARVTTPTARALAVARGCTAATVQSVLSADDCVQYRYTDAWTISLDYAAPMHGGGVGGGSDLGKRCTVTPIQFAPTCIGISSSLLF